MKTSKLTLALVTALGLGIAASATLQAGPRYGYGPYAGDCPRGEYAGRPGMMGGRHMGGPHYGPRGMGWNVDTSRLETLRGELNLSAEQQGAWDAYVAALKAHAEAVQGDREARQALSPAERRATRGELRERHQATRDALFEARDALFDTLSTEQRATAKGRLGPWCSGPQG